MERPSLGLKYQGIYFGYKADSDEVYGWLYETATECARETPGNQKAKTKKKSTIASKPPKGALANLPKLAQRILESKPDYKIPGYIIRKLESVIEGRKQCSERYEGFDDLEVQKSNEGHLFAVSTFEKVLEILLQLPVAPTKEYQPLLALDNGPSSVATSLQSLDIEDKEVALEHSSLVPNTASDRPHEGNSSSRNKPKKRRTYDLQMPANDLFFEYFCIFEEFNRIRRHVLSVWDMVGKKTTTSMVII